MRTSNTSRPALKAKPLEKKLAVGGLTTAEALLDLSIIGFEYLMAEPNLPSPHRVEP